MVLPRALILAALASAVAVSPARAHGAAVGLHIHVPEGVYRPGQVLRLQVQAKDPLRTVTLGFVGQDPVHVTPRKPARHLKVKLRIPAEATGETAGVQAEGTTEAGATVRAAAVVRLADDR